jgi:hypothetical protein
VPQNVQEFVKEHPDVSQLFREILKPLPESFMIRHGCSFQAQK